MGLFFFGGGGGDTKNLKAHSTIARILCYGDLQVVFF